ncbi:hypothetical protein [Polynucleobacter sp. JS-JIR-II-50]|uniref:hypothetical protein n=1 Tax=Polynucleobacter sp. JS-JIR-II-50 TaxID=2576919 RepID=UPI001BFD5F65|nr:hypothetical protein [Polynucleobacter sp. JS-JIR-II-50]
MITKIMQLNLRISLLVFVLSVAACSTFPSENQNPAKNNKATYNRDLKECQEDYPEVGSGVHIRQWINCMKLKGWN